MPEHQRRRAGRLEPEHPWQRGDDTVGRANALVRRGDDLEAAGLLIDVDRHEAAGQGDFWSRLFVLDSV